MESHFNGRFEDEIDCCKNLSLISLHRSKAMRMWMSAHAGEREGDRKLSFSQTLQKVIKFLISFLQISHEVMKFLTNITSCIEVSQTLQVMKFLINITTGDGAVAVSMRIRCS